MSIELQQEVLQSIEQLAEQENRTPSEVVAEAIQLYRSQKKKKMSDIEALWAIVGIGESEEDDISERDEEILASEMVDNIMRYQSDSPQEKMSGYEFLLSIAGQGHSSQHDISAHDEEILGTEVDPRHGWRLNDSNDNSG